MKTDEYILEIKEATAEDAGEYFVEAKSAAGAVATKVTVTVEEPVKEKSPVKEEPVVEAEKKAPVEAAAPKEEAAPLPVFDAEPQPVTVTEGEVIRLTCKVSGINR